MANQAANVAIGARFRELLKAQPVRRFTVTTVTGEKYQVPRGGYSNVSPGPTNVCFYDKDCHSHFFDTDYIFVAGAAAKAQEKASPCLASLRNHFFFSSCFTTGFVAS